MSQYDGEAATLVPGRLRGYREWSLTSPADGVVLLESLSARAGNARATWPPVPVMAARCNGYGGLTRRLYPEHGEVPDKQCTCGIYAGHKPDELFTLRADDPPMVVGVIEAWGRVEVGPRGFRAALARISALHVRMLYRPEEWGEPSPLDLASGRPFEYMPGGVAVQWVEAPEERAEIIVALGALYRVPMYDSYEAMISDYPPVDVDALLGREPPKPRTDLVAHPLKGMSPLMMAAALAGRAVARPPCPPPGAHHCPDCPCCRKS